MNSITVNIARPSLCIPQRAEAGDRVVFTVSSGDAQMLRRNGDDWSVCEQHDLIHSGETTDYRIETTSEVETSATLVIGEWL